MLGLDLLRTISILYIIYLHGLVYISDYVDLKKLQAIVFFDGVTSFFVLSGFLIGGIIIRLISKNKFNTPSDILTFWKRRWFRTLPNYFLVLLYLWAFQLFIMKDTSPIDFRYLFFAQNLFYPHPFFFMEAWSLSVEEWFYLTTPITFYCIHHFFKKRPKRSLLLLIAIFTLLPFILRLTMFSMNIGTWDMDRYYRTIVAIRLDSLMYGVFAAFIRFYYYDTFIKYKWQCLGVGLLMLVISKEFVHIPFLLECNYEGLAIMLVLPFLSEYKTSRIWIWKTAVTHISVISYSMYLLHISVVVKFFIPVFEKYLHITVNSLSTGLFICAVYWTMTILLSYALYILFEKPMMDLRDRGKNKLSGTTLINSVPTSS